MVSIKDIALHCGVSVATVSKALNGHSDIRPETAAKVREAADRLGYAGNTFARALKTNRTYNIGVVFDDKMCSGLSHEFFSLILESFRSEAERSGYDITFINQKFDRERKTVLQHSLYRGFDGIAVICADYEHPGIEELIRSDLPVVTLNCPFDKKPDVSSDDYNGARRLTEHAYAMGHRRIAFIHGEPTRVTGERLRGFNDACTALGLEIPEKYVLESRYHDIERCFSRTAELLDMNVRPTCILFPDDFSFIGARKAFERFGLSVPDDISAMGYDGIHIARIMKVTTYAQDTKQIGRTAAKLLIERVADRDQPNEHVIIPGDLLIGKTVKRIAEG